MSLQARSVLGEPESWQRHWPGFAAQEVDDLSLASLTARLGQEPQLRDLVSKHFGIALPPAGRSIDGNGFRFMWLAPEQWFVETDRQTVDDIASYLSETVGSSASVTEQTDAWLRLHVSGANSYAVLEKLCPLDLDPAAFPVGRVARTVMEHLGVIIMAVDAGPSFVLFTARSSARSFIHALTLAADSSTR